MTGFPWFPIGHTTASGTVGRLRAEGPGYQVLQDQTNDGLILILAADGQAGAAALTSSAASSFAGADFGGRSFLVMSIAKAAEPIPVLQWPKRFGLPTSVDVTAMGKAIADLRRRDPQAEVASALFVPPLQVCLPVKGADQPEDMRRLAAQILVASAEIPSLDFESVRSANPWVSAHDISFFLHALGVSEVAEPVTPEAFALPGRPALVPGIITE